MGWHAWARLALCIGGVALAACGASDASREAPGERSLAVWTELLSDSEISAELDFLATHELDLYLAVHADRVGDAALAELIREANTRAVGVRAWLLLPVEEGYWANEHNVEQMRELAEDFDDFRRAEGLEVEWLIFDMETSYQRTMRLNASTTDEAYALRMLEGRDPEAFAESQAKYAALVEDLQARGLKVMAVTYPQLLDDAGDCDVDLQDAYDIPIDGVPWDEVAFMIYTSAFSASFESPLEADLVQAYADLAVEQYGERASVALGIVGEAGVLPVPYPYRSPEYLAADWAAARAAGIERVSVFALDGIREQADPAAWLPTSMEPARVEVGGDIMALRQAFSDLDEFLGENTCP